MSQPHRAVFLSDLHLGSRDCQADYLVALLQELQAETIYLLGDVIDLWAMSRGSHWPHSHSQVLFELERHAQAGTRVVYIPGNHDEPLRRFCGRAFDRFEMRLRGRHRLKDGRTLLLTHGDEFDAAVCLGRFEAMVGDLGYDLLMWLNRSCQWTRKRFGLPYWSLAGYIKSRIGKAQAAIHRYRQAALQAARLEGCDGIVLGHIHQPALEEVEGLLYLNTGDFVDSCSFIAETSEGRLELIHWTEQRQLLAARAGLVARAA
ncbi:UDP-2,3-diacylglucosamine diphosphatase [Gallaecimonas kandeliae]|uniref:UDP-2,3-diacylglucosamine diphosphatase n=1 Tax=Gallaecimonas kandeliae TaxID=3029055 RepID=UPI002649406A|nr:UDP-2,3-diacylglucosamine diphosphatase [Gallaecimonas kandeliae]WKE64969.1 UDP-2,3-diacylglucosamine diphosphatase [Gallaecimonas kandeliae]